MKLLAYNLIFIPAFILYLPFFIWKLTRRGGFSHDFWERFGCFSQQRRQALAALDRPVWIHAVSVGEMVAAVSFVRRWQERNPELTFVVSTTTTTGHAVATGKLPDSVVLIYSPLDWWLPVRRTLVLVRPRAVVIFEVEFWPNMILLARRRRIPVVMANGRLSDRSAEGYARHRWFFGDLFKAFTVMCMQTEEDVHRVQSVIGKDVPAYPCNTMKFDQVPDVSGNDKSEILDSVFGPGERVVWTAGSTHAGEEELVCDVFIELRRKHPAARLVLVPRHHERTADVESVLQEKGLSYRLLQPRDRPAADGVPEPVDVLVVNTTGELMDFYGASDVVFVGKSLAGNEGGHNIIEPAIFGKPIIYGSNMQNFRAVAQIFRDGNGAVEVDDGQGLKEALDGLLTAPSERAALGKRARGVVDTWRGAIDRTLDHFEPLVQAD
ncbi:MAG: 3-deoxy-D-manno-octulosonic acid transferase [Lentisphaerae bacterium]|nr:3-deoxy-D-manno-octulosonic acid transferase [Lentisphaerota bacterium]